MTVPIELAKKAARYEKLMNEANTLFEELEEWANENGYEDFYVDGFGTAQLAEGEEQTASSFIKIGNILHQVFSNIQTADDIPQVLDRFEQDGILYGEEI